MGGRSKKQLVGYRYFIGMHLVLCQGADSITEIIYGDRRAWPGSVKTNTRISINHPELFGGEKREGGIKGAVDIEFGGPTQTVNDYLQRRAGSQNPAYRGVLGLVFRRCYFAANNPYIKKIAVRAQRFFKGLEPELAKLSNGANPAHIIYECLINESWGLGYPDSNIDVASFASAAQTLAAENFGLNFIWSKQSSVEDFLQEVLDHIEAALSVSPVTGNFVLKLIRNDYDITALPVLDDHSIIELESFERPALAETVNEVTVVFAKKSDFKSTSLVVQNIANIHSQGGVVSQTKKYPGITDPNLATRVASRDLFSASSQLARVRFRVNRTAWSLLPGDVLVFKWPPLGIEQMVLRVAEINTGELADGAIQITAVEDVFSMPDSSYVTPQQSGFTDPIPTPQKAVATRLFEAPYWELTVNLSAADLQQVDETTCFLQVVAARPAAGHYGYSLYVTDGDEFKEEADGAFCPIATLAGDLDREITSVVSYTGAVDIGFVEAGSYAYIDDEAIRIDSVDREHQTLAVTRGILDTVPAPHAEGAAIWFSDGFFTASAIEFATHEIVTAKITTTTGKGELPLADADEEVLQMIGRQARPFPPGNFKINGIAYPKEAVTGDVVITWAHRNRLHQTESFRPQSDGDITPELGTTYVVKIYAADALVRTSDEMTGASYTYTTTQELADGGPFSSLRITLESRRDNIPSWQHQEAEITSQETG